jgi:hypothetical protein
MFFDLSFLPPVVQITSASPDLSKKAVTLLAFRNYTVNVPAEPDAHLSTNFLCICSNLKKAMLYKSMQEFNMEKIRSLNFLELSDVRC